MTIWDSNPQVGLKKEMLFSSALILYYFVKFLIIFSKGLNTIPRKNCIPSRADDPGKRAITTKLHHHGFHDFFFHLLLAQKC
mmetsp:Transcript_14275/g.26997  ORF Transcript_14275/g.26997 Transcript_14275/m.26997 type:complete len:82 (+) Transcript_14275:199-444(+)